MKEKQTCMQPKFGKNGEQFGKNGEQFKRNQTLHSAYVAVIRAGNERAVSRVKMSWLLKRGTVEQLWDMEMFADIWLAAHGASKSILCMTLSCKFNV
jgi:hypothetical protein